MSDLESQQNFTSIQDLIVALFDLAGTFLILWIFLKVVDKEKFYKLGFKT